MSKPDLTEFFEVEPKTCIASKTIDKLSKEDKEKVLAAFEESTINGMSIVRFIQKRNVDIKHTAVIKHRKKECVCYAK